MSIGLIIIIAAAAVFIIGGALISHITSEKYGGDNK